MRFEFATASRVVFGSGTWPEAVSAASVLGRRVLLMTGRDPERAAGMRRALEGKGLEIHTLAVPGEPTVGLAEGGARFARESGSEVVLALGGGSVIDAAKAVAAMATNPGSLLDYLEVIGRGQSLSRPGLPCLAIPTTAGTGAEVTRNTVLASPEHRVKVSLRSPWMLPCLAVVDPELTLGLPSGLTASTGLDALTQLIEPYVCARTNPMVDGFCEDGLRRVSRSLRSAWATGKDMAAREDMALASLLGGFSLANAGLGAVHGFAGPIGGMYPAPHGAVCAALLPHVMEVNQSALRARAPGSEALRRYEVVARLLTGRSEATFADGVRWVADLCRDLNTPPLRNYGITPEAFPRLIEKARVASSMKANPIVLTDAELEEILARAV